MSDKAGVSTGESFYESATYKAGFKLNYSREEVQEEIWGKQREASIFANHLLEQLSTTSEIARISKQENRELNTRCKDLENRLQEMQVECLTLRNELHRKEIEQSLVQEYAEDVKQKARVNIELSQQEEQTHIAHIYELQQQICNKELIISEIEVKRTNCNSLEKEVRGLQTLVAEYEEARVGSLKQIEELRQNLYLLREQNEQIINDGKIKDENFKKIKFINLHLNTEKEQIKLENQENISKIEILKAEYNEIHLKQCRIEIELKKEQIKCQNFIEEIEKNESKRKDNACNEEEIILLILNNNELKQKLSEIESKNFETNFNNENLIKKVLSLEEENIKINFENEEYKLKVKELILSNEKINEEYKKVINKQKVEKEFETLSEELEKSRRNELALLQKIREEKIIKLNKRNK